MTSPIVDWWVIPHVAFFIVLASSIEALKSYNDPLRNAIISWPKSYHLMVWLIVTLSWEVAEHFLQRRFTEQWSGVIEHPLNAWLVDPVSNGIGYIIGYKVARWSKNRSIRT